MKVERAIYSLFGASLLLINASAYATGKVKTTMGVYDYILNFSDQDVSNTIGTQIKKGWEVGSIPSGQWYIQCTSLDNNVPVGIPVFYTGHFAPGLIQVKDNVFSLDDHWNISAAIYITGGKDVIRADVPFDSRSNNYQNAPARCFRLGDNYPSTSNLATGKKGDITLILKKKIVNGYAFVSSPIIYLAGATSASEVDINDPYARVIIGSFAISLPEKCEINAGQSIDIDFGDVATTKLDGNHYPVKKALTVSCSGGEFESGLGGVSTEFLGGVSRFSDDYFSSSHSGIGIALKDDTNHVIKPHDKRRVNITNGKGSLPVIFAPVAESKGIEAGEFNANIVVKLLLE